MKTLTNVFTRAIIPSLLAMSVAQVSANEYDEMQKQLDIMSKIIKSSTGADDRARRGHKINGVESVYLKGQGVVFTVNSSSNSNHWGNYNFKFVLPEMPAIAPTAPVPPVPPIGSAHEMDEEAQIEIEKSVAEAMEYAAETYEKAIESLHEDRERYRDIRNEQRDASYEIRDLEREKRDIEFQLRRADEASKSELKSKLKELEKEKEKHKKVLEELSLKAKELQKVQLAKRAAQEKERVTYYQGLTNKLAEAFCLYGNGLRALPKNENVSLIIKSAGEKEHGRYKDKIFVFSKKDILSCSADNISVAKLVEKGQGYEF